MTNSAGTRLATRLSFFAAGYVMACWAPLIPFAKDNVAVDEAGLGMLLLCLGIGSISAMPFTGWLAAKIGSKPLILAGGAALVILLPVLMLLGSVALLALALALFGAALGTIDVAMNIHATEVEKESNRPLMSGFHAMFSIGGFAGAGVTTLLLSLGTAPLAAAGAGSLVALAALGMARTRLLRAQAGEPMTFALPHGIVMVIAALTAIIFLVEGAVMDWGALLITERALLPSAQAGIGYMLFAGAMTLGRLTGDRTIATFGNASVIVGGSVLALIGIGLLLLADAPALALAGFAFIGLGAANIVPILFSLAGKQKVMPPALAVAAVTTVGYAGILLGPALLGFIAHRADLVVAFGAIGLLTATIPFAALAVLARLR